MMLMPAVYIHLIGLFIISTSDQSRTSSSEQNSTALMDNRSRNPDNTVHSYVLLIEPNPVQNSYEFYSNEVLNIA